MSNRGVGRSKTTKLDANPCGTNDETHWVLQKKNNLNKGNKHKNPKYNLCINACVRKYEKVNLVLHQSGFYHIFMFVYSP